ncbi:hypothetical protein DTX80_09325 [Bacilli bacterium]|nr:hypothetical protein WH51_03670 [Bacilli bacterium VT-13-104]PZD86449.1 hypothetical protein DEJ64_07690 [Bacilli bacterium]PZD88099.1 hypothetical protein DEJ60_07380 [Bacilli bacterium]PZD90961.1 hypothetical protein DEJ66_08035 [Bacilli bacterium]RCO05824.1 hypothetical protein DTX80_09325 [Bacilli bacterium]
MSLILTQEPQFVQQEVLKGLQQYDKRASVQVNTMILYPYYFLEFEVSAKSLLKFNGKIACTIDTISGQGAIIDVQPEFIQRPIVDEKILPIEISEKEAEQLAEKFIFQAATQKAKFITIPTVTIHSTALFYRPFWLAEYNSKVSGGREVIVDAISGSYHPL